MNETPELAQFVRDRLGEARRIALAATQGDWVWTREFVAPPGYHYRTIGPLEPGDAAHIARQDPKHVLADIESKLRLIDFLRPNEVYGWSLRLLALPYSDHPDYREKWRP